jgi:hypothetical protein
MENRVLTRIGVQQLSLQVQASEEIQWATQTFEHNDLAPTW